MQPTLRWTTSVAYLLNRGRVDLEKLDSIRSGCSGCQPGETGKKYFRYNNTYWEKGLQKAVPDTNQYSHIHQAKRLT